MLSKISVKKPYTVFVGIILVIILGIVSFTKMTTDLLPNINLPYAIIMTTYPGASPEVVESVVTKPVEQAMATVSNIEGIQSVSAENYSMVILQFAQTTNMDSVSIEMRENLDQISGYWDDMVGKPVIMKLNPDMLPVMTAAVEKDGLEGAALTDYVNRELVSDLESIEGVASVSLSGGIEESVQVIIRQDKIDEVNVKVQDALNGKFEDAEAELNDAKAEIEKGKNELEKGQKELNNKLAEVSKAEAEILKGEAQIEAAEKELAVKEAEVDATLAMLEEQKAQLQAGNIAKDETYQAAYDQAYTAAVEQGYQAMLGELQKQIDTSQARINEIQASIDAGTVTPDEMVEQATLQATVQALQTQLAGLKTEAGKAAALPQIEAQVNAVFPAEFDKNYATEAIKAVDGYIAQAKDGKAQIDAGKAELAKTKEELRQGKITLSEAQGQIESAKVTATIQMAAAQAQLASGEAQIEDGLNQLETAKEQALQGADLSKMVTTELVSNILMAENFSMPAGYITEDGIEYLVRVGDKFADADEISDMVLFDMGIEGLEPIQLNDVADVAVINNSEEVYASINGEPGVILSIQKQTGYSTGEVSEKIKAYFEKVMGQDETLYITPVMDQGIYIDFIVDSVLSNLIMGGALAIIILFFFLKDIKPTAVIACSIPISVMTAIMLMYFSGVTLNIISLSGLALGVGMLVDNSVVVIENIYRLRNEGMSARKAAMEGAKEVSGAIVASTLTTVCVFLPIVFTEGITRQLFVDMGLTIAYSLLASLVVALTLVPAMSAGLLKNTKEKPHPWFDKFIGAYEVAARWTLKHKAIVLIGSLVLLIGSGLLSYAKGLAFIPEMESTQMTVTATLDEDATVKETGEIADEVAKRLLTFEDVTDVGAMVGSGGISLGGSSATNSTTIYVLLKEDKEHTNNELAKLFEAELADLDCDISVTASSMDMSALGGSGISIQIKGKELDSLQELAGQVAAVLDAAEGTVEVSDGMEDSTLELRVVVDKEKAMSHNLTVAQVYQQIAAKIAAEKNATTLSTESKDYPVMLADGAQTSYTRDDIKDFMLTATDAEGNTEEIPIADVVDFEDAFSPQAINRINQSRYINVTAKIDSDYNITQVAAEVQEELDQMDVPDGYTVTMAGEDETINEAMIELLKMMGLAVIFMYLIMVAQFQSLLSPFIVMFTIPLAFTGGFMGLVIAGSEISVIAMLGFIMLAGIIVNNGIVYVDYANQLREAGMEKHEALVQAGKVRMRPILMTALTTILGLSTMALGAGMGTDMVQPMAVVTIGGLIYGTALTLFVVPCIYDILNRKEYKREDDDDEQLELESM